MAQSIKNLAIGSKIEDNKGNRFCVVARNHYMDNSVTLHAVNDVATSIMHSSSNVANNNYGNSQVAYFLRNSYGPRLQKELSDAVLTTQVPYMDRKSTTQSSSTKLDAKYFIPSVAEVLGGGGGEGSRIPALADPSYWDLTPWTRSEYDGGSGFTAGFYCIEYSHYFNELRKTSVSPTTHRGIRVLFNVTDTLLVSDTVSNGYYSFLFNHPPVIANIQYMQGNYGSGTNITYTVTDKDDASLMHKISFDNGNSWHNITPTRNGNTYTYTHVFSRLGSYECRVRVTDSANNTVDSNMFIVSINNTHPVVNIINVIDRVITFKTNCVTDEITRVEVRINGTIRETFTNGFEFNLMHEINRDYLTEANNTIELRAISSANLTMSRFLQAKKDTYTLPPVGTKILIGEQEYTIEGATQNGSNQEYTLNSNLASEVTVNQPIHVMQDKVTVKCCLSNVDNATEYIEMRLAKIKKLKGDFEGYVEERYELVGEGRYSTIKLDLERFNNAVASEIIELQQHFDYMED